MTIKINMGCGKRNFGKEWIHIDQASYDHIDHKDIFNFPYEDVDLIYASHLIEYFNREEVIELLKIWKSKLRQGGLLRLAVPDFESIASLYLSKKFELDSFLGPLYGKMQMNTDTIYHKTVYDFKSLKQLLNGIGFKNIKKWNHWDVAHGKFDDHSQAYLPHLDKTNGTLISLNIEGTNIN